MCRSAGAHQPGDVWLVFLYKWFTGGDPPAPGNVGVPAPALFYTVLQLVGPNLTPQTWRDALFLAPATPGAISQPSLSYGDQKIWPVTDYLGVDDATAIWWDPSVAGPDELGRNGHGMSSTSTGRGTNRLMAVATRCCEGWRGLPLRHLPKGEEPPNDPSPVRELKSRSARPDRVEALQLRGQLITGGQIAPRGLRTPESHCASSWRTSAMFSGFSRRVHRCEPLRLSGLLQ